jgi:hypothetical protein
MSYWCEHNHYYYDKPIADLDNILERLKRKYQTYKASTLMEKKTDPKQLYSDLITVDYLKIQEDDENKSFDKYVID